MRRRSQPAGQASGLRAEMAARYRQRAAATRPEPDGSPGMLGRHWLAEAERWDGSRPVICPAWKLPASCRAGLEPYDLVEVDAAGAVTHTPHSAATYIETEMRR